MGGLFLLSCGSHQANLTELFIRYFFIRGSGKEVACFSLIPAPGAKVAYLTEHLTCLLRNGHAGGKMEG